MNVTFLFISSFPLFLCSCVIPGIGYIDAGGSLDAGVAEFNRQREASFPSVPHQSGIEAEKRKPKPAEEKRPEWKFASKVPGKEGYVFSPYNGRVIDIKGIPSGTLVQDPTYTGEGKGYFRVP